jgi:hypothetical protein
MSLPPEVVVSMLSWRKCQNSGHVAIAVLIFPTWWLIAANNRRSPAHESTTNRSVPHFWYDSPEFWRPCTEF